MRQISRTAFLVTGLMLIAGTGFAQGTSPSQATGGSTAPVQAQPARPAMPTPQAATTPTPAPQAARTATPSNPGGATAGATQRPAVTTTPQAGTPAAPRTDQRSQVAPTAPAPVRTN
jgi:hypothetical protein